MTEQDWQQMVLDLARIGKWRTMHVRRSIGKGRRWTTATSCDGWPDLVLWKPCRFLAAELKSEKGQLTDEQRVVLDSLHEAGVETFVWRPSDLDTVAHVLTSRTSVLLPASPEASR